MKYLIGLVASLLGLLALAACTEAQSQDDESPNNKPFVREQKKYPRVRQAYAQYYGPLRRSLADKGLDIEQLDIFMVAYKKEGKLKLYARNQGQKEYNLFKTYPICKASGDLGPKQREGDRQVPEGFYEIERYNPKSQFHLSLGLNYPNAEDRKRNASGTDIFIHGQCLTVGCLPMTDAGIEEIYLLACQAKGNKPIRVEILPFDFEAKENQSLWTTPKYAQHRAFWQDLAARRSRMKD